jgi:hypothetical protein
VTAVIQGRATAGGQAAGGLFVLPPPQHRREGIAMGTWNEIGGEFGEE